MASVTQRIKQIKQPRGGYLNPKQFQVTEYHDGEILFQEENIHASLVGTVVDYLTRFTLYEHAESAFQISILGAEKLELAYQNNAKKDARKLARGIRGLDTKSIINACKLSGYDVCYRAGIHFYKPVEEILPDAQTIHNIAVMVRRGVSLFQDYNVDDMWIGFDLTGAYNTVINAGDGDYMTPDTIWDFKVSKSEPDSKQTLQLLVYYIMGQQSIYPDFFGKIKKLGIFNPRLNKSYIISISDIPSDVIKAVSRDVIGYR